MKLSSKTLRKQKALRPTAGKVRGALFNILRGRIENAIFLDLYAGTGTVGIDAIKQGASKVVFVEESKGYSKKTLELIKKLRVSEKARVITKKVLSFIEWAELNQMTFDIIFLDPPYNTDEIFYALSAIGRSSILIPNGMVIAEHFIKKQLPDNFDTLQKIKDYNYGDTILSFYIKK